MPTEILVTGGVSDNLRRNWAWFLALGILLIVVGVFAIAMPLVSSLAVGAMLAIVFVVAGLAQIIQAFRVRAWTGFVWHLVVGIVLVVGGLAVYARPAVGSGALTLVVAAIFLAKGIAQIGFALRVRPLDGWGWFLAAGLVALAVGLLILFRYPFSGLWVPGVFAGISLTFTGWAYVMIGLAARRIGKA